ncbi:DUF6168 family protein [Nonlabens ponticola]|uniref:Uncharacterized protein n=1 Tax=Nonlabens ponticola TaxID=2496866 RepID=A0A3S9MVF5_9FLAO|nr:DUF6168 family protein [Nonlabens ponticola]AZQ43206.1 hypothetical protein EJ995_02760 [Nonlabens ponticola]
MKFYLQTFIVILVCCLIAYFVHDWYVDNPAISPLRIYLFLGLATFLTVSALKFTHAYVPDKLGYAFLAAIFIKCGAALVLFPELIAEDPALSKRQLLGFIAPYFIFLFVEVGIVIKWLNKN